jgi:hypothetical protein
LGPLHADGSGAKLGDGMAAADGPGLRVPPASLGRVTLTPEPHTLLLLLCMLLSEIAVVRIR